MICKKDVILWFKELESYKRIDTMCALLNMCLPFELRFLGTCLEELGRRDSQELRGMELRVNNPTDLTTDVLACQQGEPTDKKIRRKMAMYLALIRASNRTCVTEIFRTIEGWGERDFLSMTDADTLQELLLVYMMAANHPIFSFEQHMKCTEIFEKIKENKLVGDPPPPSAQYYENSVGYGQQQQQQQQQPQPHLQPATQQLSQPDLRQPLAMTHQDMMQQQHALHALHLTGQHAQMQVPPPTMQVLPQGTLPLNFQQGHMTKLIPSDSSMPHQLTVDGLHVVSPSNTIPMDPNTIMRHPDVTWALRTYPPPLDQPPPAASPIVSQHSSPASSRATSPNRPLPPSSGGGGMHPMSQQQQRRMGGGGGSMKNIRRPSVETTPPPMASQQQQLLSNDLILPQNMKHDEVVDGSGQQLQSLIRNGYTRSGHQRMKANMYQQQQQQQTSVNQQQQQHYQTLPPGSYTIGLGYAMQSMSLGDPSLAHHMDGGMSSLSSTKSNGSDSGSPLGSCTEVSPPETPTLMTNSTSSSGGGGNMRMSPSDHQPQQQQQQPQKMHHQRGYSNQMGGRMNGRFDKMLPVSATSGAPPAGSTIVYAQAAATHQHQMTQQQQQQQSQQQMYSASGSDIILAPGGNAGAAGNIMQSSMTGGGSNNNVSGQTGGGNAPNTATGGGNTSNTNCNMTNAAPATATAVLISSASPAGNVISTNSVILQQHQPQYSTTFPFHIATATRPPPLIAHNPSMAPPPAPPTFRMSGFQLPPNDVLYPYHHPSGGLTFLSSAGAPVGMRAASASAVAAATPTAQPPPPLAAVPSPLLSSPYPSLAAPLPTNKPPPPVSCYNCGSQQHCGRDCPEASMDDVTRNAIYKLDYSVSAAASNMSPTTTTTTPGGSSSGASGTGSSSSSSSSGQLEHSKSSDGSVSTAASSASSATSAAAATAASVSGPGNTK